MKFLKNFYRKFACKIGWHSPSYLWKPVEISEGIIRCKCPWCGFEGLVDSQGNLF